MEAVLTITGTAAEVAAVAAAVAAAFPEALDPIVAATVAAEAEPKPAKTRKPRATKAAEPVAVEPVAPWSVVETKPGPIVLPGQVGLFDDIFATTPVEPAPVEPAPVAPTPAVVETPTLVTDEDLTRALTAYMVEHGTPAAVATLAPYKVPKVTAIPQELRAAYLASLNA